MAVRAALLTHELHTMSDPWFKIPQRVPSFYGDVDASSPDLSVYLEHGKEERRIEQQRRVDSCSDSVKHAMCGQE